MKQENCVPVMAWIVQWHLTVVVQPLLIIRRLMSFQRKLVVEPVEHLSLFLLLTQNRIYISKYFLAQSNIEVTSPEFAYTFMPADSRTCLSRVSHML